MWFISNVFYFQNSFEADLSVQDVCRDGYLTDLLTKYDTRLNNTNEIIKEKQIELQHSKEVTERSVDNSNFKQAKVVYISQCRKPENMKSAMRVAHA